jgi:hypothetical protein
MPVTTYYADEAVTIVHADWRDVPHSKLWEGVSHLISDPPYGEHTHAKQWIGAALTADAKPRVSTAHIRSKGLDYVRTCIWDKVDGAPQFTGDRPAAGAEAIVAAHRAGKKRWNGGGKRNVYRHAVNGDRGAKPHPSTKPEALMCELIADFTDASDLILDPYAGSGTTGVAAKRLGRRAILIEREEKYCEVAAKRLSQGALELFQSPDAVDPQVGISNARPRATDLLEDLR